MFTELYFIYNTILYLTTQGQKNCSGKALKAFNTGMLYIYAVTLFFDIALHFSMIAILLYFKSSAYCLAEAGFIGRWFSWFLSERSGSPV